MLVFRCECEHVIGVESAASAGQPGECPACGRIIRVPDAPVNAKGRLKLATAPTRATPSGAFRQIKDTKMDGPELSAPKPGSSNGAMKSAPSPVPPTPPPTFDASKLSEEPEILAPLTAEEENNIAGAETMITEPEEQTEIPAMPEKKIEAQRKPPSKAPRVTPETQVKQGTVTAVGVASSSSKRRRMEADAASAAPAAKKNPLLLVAVVAVIVLVIVGVLYFMGVFEKTPAANNNSATAAKKAESDKKADADKKNEAAKAPEPAPNPDEKKKEDQK